MGDGCRVSSVEGEEKTVRLVIGDWVERGAIGVITG
jgi:hypothetical protein